MRILDANIKIGNLEVKNRLVMPPMAISKTDERGMATEQTFDYYNEKSAGGYIGLLIAEHSYVSPEGKAHKGQLSISKEEDLAGLERIVSIVHNNGTKIMAQINHAGAAAMPNANGLELLSASAVQIKKDTPKAMDQADIEKVIDDFTKAALRAKKAGFDGVEIHSAHGYLLNQFYSPLTNRRDDAYTGATMDGRIRLHLEIIQSIRAAVGSDYPLALRLGACDYMEGGSTIADSVLAAKAFEQAGIDLMDLSGGLCGYVNPTSKKQGYFDEISKAVKENVSIPVILTGGIVDAEAAELLLEEKKADLIGVGLAIFKDSAWAKNAMTLH